MAREDDVQSAVFKIVANYDGSISAEHGIGIAKRQRIAHGEPMKPVFTIAGLVVLALGLLFVGQGSGLIPWPARSFMVRQTEWVYYGAAIAAAGLLLIVLARR